MTQNLKVFFAAFLVSLPFWWQVNIFQEKTESFFFWKTMAENPELLTAQVAQEEQLAKLRPLRNRRVENLELAAESAISVFIDREGQERILFEKESKKPLPIASLTKLMTAKVALEYYDISQIDLARLLYHLLIASDNSSATTLAEIVGQDAFVSLMNLETKESGLANTYFVNPTGLDPDEEQHSINYSTAEDLVKLAQHITANQPLIWEITALSAFEDSVNTNTLLEEFPRIIGGKTGWTPRANGCLVLVLKSPGGRGLIINVVLGSGNRSEEMKALINWVNSAYHW